MWHGGYAWGPRFLVSVLPFLALLSGPAWDRLLLRREGGMAGLAAAGVCIAISVLVQWPGMLAPFRLVGDHLAELVTPLFASQTFNRPALSPLVLQWRFLSAENLPFAWWRGGDGPAALDSWCLALPLLGVMAGAWLLLRAARRDSGGMNVAALRWAGALYGLAMLAVTLVLLLRVQMPLSGAENAALAGQIARQERAGDAILHLAHVETQQFANVYHGRLPTYGLENAAELLPGDDLRLARIVEEYGRLWVVSAGGDAAGSPWEAALTVDAALVSVEHFGGDAGHRLALYIRDLSVCDGECPQGNSNPCRSLERAVS